MDFVVLAIRIGQYPRGNSARKELLKADIDKVYSRALRTQVNIGESPSGKAAGFGPAIRGFESFLPSQFENLRRNFQIPLSSTNGSKRSKLRE